MDHPTAMDLLAWTALAAAGAVGLTVLVRNVPFVQDWVMEAKKPWACNVCMPIYTTAAMLAIPIWQTGDWRYAAAYLPAYGLAYTGLQRMAQPPGPPVIPADLLTEDD